MVRDAQIGDYQSIAQIKQQLSLDIDHINDNNYKIDAKSRGFLIPSPYSQEEFEADLKKIF